MIKKNLPNDKKKPLFQTIHFSFINFFPYPKKLELSFWEQMWCLSYFISKVGVSHNIPPYFHLLLYKKITPPNPLTVEEPISFIWWGYPSIYYIITSFDMFQYFILFFFIFLSVFLFLHLITFVYIDFCIHFCFY